MANRNNRTHGMTGTRIHSVWVNMRQRCSNPRCTSFGNYGGRGITVCERWESSFEAFLADMGHPPAEIQRPQIDRINNNGNYEPGNCRWTTAKENARNKRDNRIVTYRGRQMTLSEACERKGIRESVIVGRMYRNNRTLEEAFAMKLRARSSKRYVIWQGERISEAQLAARYGLHKDVIYRRLTRGWSLERAVTTPAKLIGKAKFKGEGVMGTIAEEGRAEGQGLATPDA